MTVPVSDLQAAAPSAIIELFELALDASLHGSSDIWRFHNGSSSNNNGTVIWNGQTYMRYPIECEGFEFSGKGTLPQPKLRISNIMGTITALLLTANATTPGNDLIGAKLTRIRTLAKYIDAANWSTGINPYGTPNPSIEFPREVFFLSQKSAENRDVVEFLCSASFDLQGVRAPKRQCISNICQWTYKGTECGYAGTSYYDASDNIVASSSLDVCGKRLSSCKARYESFARTGVVIAGSASMTVSSTANIVVGNPVSGVGIAAGTTVSAITNSTTLVLSAVATASTNSVKTGTASSAGASLSVTNATGLIAGQTITGTYIPNGTTVSSISGTTLTLSARPYSFTRSGTYVNVFNSVFYISIDVSGLSAGMSVWGPNGINTTIASVATNNPLGNRITLNSYGSLGLDAPINLTLYFMPASPGSSSYTFGITNNNYVFRDPTSALPYGSFPAVGLYLQ